MSSLPDKSDLHALNFVREARKCIATSLDESREVHSWFLQWIPKTLELVQF